MLSEHSVGSYCMAGTMPRVVRAGQMPEQQVPWWKASEEADERGCRVTGGRGLGSGCPWMLLREAP